jgi:DNA-directed RNA polymerase subunit RPC12/RpoP
MSVQVCPKCRRRGFTWAVEDDGVTRWYCSLCGFSAEEDEAKQIKCPRCDSGFAAWLAEDGESYYWCFSCNQQVP